MMIKVVSPLYKFLRDEELLQVSQLQVTYEQKDKDLHQWPDVHPLIGAYTRVAESVLSCLQNMKSMHSDYHHRACSSIMTVTNWQGHIFQTKKKFLFSLD